MAKINPFTPDRVMALHFSHTGPTHSLIFDIWTLRTQRQSAQMSKNKNSGLDQYDTEPFEQQQFGKAGVEGVKTNC